MRLSENAHLLRYPHPSSLRRTSMYASFLGILEALQLDIFHQPLRCWFLDTLYSYLAMGVSFQGRNHCSGDGGTAPKSNVIMVAAPQGKVAGTTKLLCASPGSPELLAWGR